MGNYAVIKFNYTNTRYSRCPLSDDSKTLYIHAIDADDVEETVASIRNSFEKAILEVSRS